MPAGHPSHTEDGPSQNSPEPELALAGQAGLTRLPLEFLAEQESSWLITQAGGQPKRGAMYMNVSDRHLSASLISSLKWWRGYERTIPLPVLALGVAILDISVLR
jgi:hypothetical protein